MQTNLLEFVCLWWALWGGGEARKLECSKSIKSSCVFKDVRVLLLKEPAAVIVGLRCDCVACRLYFNCEGEPSHCLSFALEDKVCTQAMCCSFCFFSHFLFLLDLRPDIERRKRKQEIKQSTIFKKKEDSKEKLARHLAGLAKANSRVSSSMTSVFGDRSSPNVLIGKKGNLQRKDTEQKSSSPEVKLNKEGNDTTDSEMNLGKGGENIVGSKEEPTASASSATDDSEVMKDNDNGTEKLKTLAIENDSSADMQGSFLVVYSSSNDSCTSEEDTWIEYYCMFKVYLYLHSFEAEFKTVALQQNLPKFSSFSWFVHTRRLFPAKIIVWKILVQHSK